MHGLDGDFWAVIALRGSDCSRGGGDSDTRPCIVSGGFDRAVEVGD